MIYGYARVSTAQKEVDFNSKIDLTAKFKNEQTIFKTIKNLNFNQFNKAVNCNNNLNTFV